MLFIHEYTDTNVTIARKDLRKGRKFIRSKVIHPSPFFKKEYLKTPPSKDRICHKFCFP